MSQPDATPTKKKLREKLTSARNLGTAALWLVTTVSSAVLGAVAVSYVEQARPNVVIADVSTSTAFNDRFGKHQVVTVPLSDPLFEHLQQSHWVRDIRDQTAELDTVVGVLTEDKFTLDDLLQSLDNFRLALPDLKTLLSLPATQATAEAFFDKWERLDSLIYASIDGEARRGEVTAAPDRDYGDKRPYLLLGQRTFETKSDTSVQVFAVQKKGGVYVSAMVPERREQLLIAKQIAYALAYFDQEVIEKYLDVVSREEDAYSLDEQMRDEISQYLSGYSRWSVSVLIENAGARPISFSPNATMYVNTKNTSVGDRFVVVNLESRKENGDLEPVTVAGGETKVITFVSRDLVLHDPRWKLLLDLFASKSRECFVVLHPESELWTRSPDVPSSVRIFGPSSGGRQLSEDEIAARFAKFK